MDEFPPCDKFPCIIISEIELSVQKALICVICIDNRGAKHEEKIHRA